jgi:Arc/MetJ family transcription regulator
VGEQRVASDGVSVPLSVRVRLARPAVQLIADEVGADILHIKGDAVDAALRKTVVPGTDVDALVRPAHIPRLDAGLLRRGWRLYSTFLYGSPFGHAQTYEHPMWGYFDLHRSFPGIRIDPALAFDLLWGGSHVMSFPGASGRVPSLEMQATILVLNSARSSARALDPVARWVEGPGLDRAAVEASVRQLDARVAFAAATGDLERFRGEPDYALWRVISQGGSRTAEWIARVRAAGSAAEALRIVGRAPLVNIEQLTHDLGRAPTRGEVAAAFMARPMRALRELPWRRRQSRP